MGRTPRICVYNQTRDAFVATEAAIADTPWSRLVGLLGKNSRWARPGRGLWIVPSRGIHTIGMMFPLDLLFLDQDKHVVEIQEHLPPFRISSVCLRAASVLELPPHTVFRSGTRVGDQLEIVHLD